MEIVQLANLLNKTVVPELFGITVNPEVIKEYNNTSPEVTIDQSNARNNTAFLTWARDNSKELNYQFALTEDLSNFADFGAKFDNVTDEQLKTSYQKLLLGLRQIWVRQRKYELNVPDIFIPSEEYGAVIEMVQFGTCEYSEYNGRTLVDGRTYNQDKYHATGEDTRIFSNQSVIEIEASIPNDQLLMYFQNATKLNEFVSGLMLKWDNTMSLAIETVVYRTINAMLAGSSNVINLVTLYNNTHKESVTASTAMQTPEFLRWFSITLRTIKKMLTRWNKVYNDETIEQFTPESNQHLILLDMFANSVETYLFADTYHDDYLKRYGKYDTVAYWQTRGNELLPTIETAGDINVTIDKSLISNTSGNETVHLTNVVGALFDDYSCGISLRAGGENVRTHFNAKGDFINWFLENSFENFIDTRAACVVFTLN